MNYNIGNKIKDLRKYLHITQAELAQNICSQAMISKIEKHEEIYPSAELLYQISQRLGVTIDYFFQETELLNINYVNDVCDQLNSLIQLRKFEEAYRVVKLEQKNPHFQEPHLRRYLLWREAICVCYLEEDVETALELIDKALALSKTTKKNYSIEELDILTSKAIFLGILNKWSAADQLYENILSHAKKSVYQKGKGTLANIYYNYSRTSLFLGNYTRALTFANSGIALCKEEKTIFLLGHLYYQKAESLSKIEGKVTTEILNIYKDAVWVFRQIGDEKSLDYVQSKINTSPISNPSQ